MLIPDPMLHQKQELHDCYCIQQANLPTCLICLMQQQAMQQQAMQVCKCWNAAKQQTPRFML